MLASLGRISALVRREQSQGFGVIHCAWVVVIHGLEKSHSVRIYVLEGCHELYHATNAANSILMLNIIRNITTKEMFLVYQSTQVWEVNQSHIQLWWELPACSSNMLLYRLIDSSLDQYSMYLLRYGDRSKSSPQLFRGLLELPSLLVIVACAYVA